MNTDVRKYSKWLFLLAVAIILPFKIVAQQFINGNFKFTQRPGMYWYKNNLPFYGYSLSHYGLRYISIYKNQSDATLNSTCIFHNAPRAIIYDKGAIEGLDTLNIDGKNVLVTNIERITSNQKYTKDPGGTLLQTGSWRRDSICEIGLPISADTLSGLGWSLKLNTPLQIDSSYNLTFLIRNNIFWSSYFWDLKESKYNLLPIPWKILIYQSASEHSQGELLDIIDINDVLGLDSSIAFQGSIIEDTKKERYCRINKKIKGKNSGSYLTIRAETEFNDEISRKYFDGYNPRKLDCDNYMKLSAGFYVTKFEIQCPVKIIGSLNICDTSSGSVLKVNDTNQNNTYYWNTGSTEKEIKVYKPGKYVLTRNRNGCIGKDSIIISLMKHKPIGFDSTICQGRSVLIGNNIPAQDVQYSWNSGSKSCCLTTKLSGSFVRITKIGDCAYKDTFNIRTEPGHLAIDNLNYTSCHDSQLVLTSYISPTQWSKGNKILSTNQSFTIKTSNSDTVTLITKKYCQQIDTIIIKTINCGQEAPIFIPTAFTPDENGLNETFIFHSNGGWQTIDLVIYNTWGELLFRGNKGWDGNYLNRPCPQGTYFWKLQVHNISTGKVKTISGTVLLIR